MTFINRGTFLFIALLAAVSMLFGVLASAVEVYPNVRDASTVVVLHLPSHEVIFDHWHLSTCEKGSC